MKIRIKRRVKQAFAIAKRDPRRVAMFFNDLFLYIGLIALLVILYKSCYNGII